METTVSRQGDFQLRLAQWLLDQLNSRGELETVTQQFSFLVSQVQEQSIEGLYQQIGKLIFQKIARIKLEDFRIGIRLCAELCYSLFTLHVKQRSSLPFRVILIHEHIFRLCIDSISAECTINLGTGTSSMPPRNGDAISIERNSELLFYLCDFHLISLAQICEYMHRVTDCHKKITGVSLSNAATGIRQLNGLFPDHSPVPWSHEKNAFDEWIDAHPSLNEGQTITIVGRASSQEKLHTSTEVDGASIQHKMPFPLGDRDSVKVSFVDPFNGLVSSDKIILLTQSQSQEEEIDGVARNNLGKPPQTPVASRPESPANKHLEEGSVLTRVTAGAEYQLEQERRKAAKEKEEREQRGKEKIEKEQSKEQAERKVEDEAKREAERKAERERRFEEEEAKREDILEADRKAGAERMAREEAEHVAEEARQKEEVMRRKAAALKAKEEEKHKARELNERRLAERKAKREAGRKAKEEEERVAEEQACKEAEQKAKDEARRKARAEAEREEREERKRIAQEERARIGEERRVRREVERRAKREAEQHARTEVERKAKEEEERKAKEEKERQARVEVERREAQEKAREKTEHEGREIEEREAREAAEVAARAEEEEREEREAAEASDRATAEAIVKEEMERERAKKEREKWLKYLQYLEGFTTPTGRAQGKRNYRM
ncbi:hypothetical protein B0J17DRAFT_679921 [Rhizoctonia solani]|nr:hypothetical protein B0J17DRAFT_679921 [Rhizoctonia solani]